MAVTNEKSSQLTDLDATPPKLVDTHELHGRVRISYFEFTQGAAAGDATSTVQLCDLPPGKVRLLMADARIHHSAFGASRVLDVGWDAYTDTDGNDVTADPDGLANDKDVSSAGAIDLTGVVGTHETKLFDSRGGVRLRATVAGGTIPAGATLGGYVKYVTD